MKHGVTHALWGDLRREGATTGLDSIKIWNCASRAVDIMMIVEILDAPGEYIILYGGTNHAERVREVLL